MSSIGTEYKINVGMRPVGDIHLENCDFYAEFYTFPLKKVRIAKVDMMRVNADNYLAVVDSAKTGAGELHARVVVYLPDADMPDGKRTEVVNLDTDIVVEK
jgi:hypothetical protein